MKTYRKNIRLKSYDYANNGAYFVTICTQGRQPILVGDRSHITDQILRELPERFVGLAIDFSSLMPNHLHMILVLNNCEASIPRIMQAFKSLTTLQIKRLGYKEKRFWQPNYYEHVVRNEKSLAKIREYVINNPLAENLEWEELDNMP